MKKIIGIMAAMLMVASVAIACPPNGGGQAVNTANVAGGEGIEIYTEHGDTVNGGEAFGTTDNTYKAGVKVHNGPATALGGSASTGTVEGQSEAMYNGRVGLSYSQSNVDSVAGTRTNRPGLNKVTVSGTAAQANWAGAEDGIAGDPDQGYAGAVGGNMSEAEYDGKLRRPWRTGLEGDAMALGGTAAGAYTAGDLSMAGAVTGGVSEANLSPCNGKVKVNGEGGVKHVTYATDGVGNYAHTNGTADYTYKANGSNHVTGYGVAATGGVSYVGSTPNGVTATSMSGGVSHSNSGTGVSNPVGSIIPAP